MLAYWGLTQVRKSYLAKQILQLPAFSAIARGTRIEVSPEVAGESVGTMFPHPWDVLMWSGRFAHTVLWPCATLLRIDPEPGKSLILIITKFVTDQIYFL